MVQMHVLTLTSMMMMRVHNRRMAHCCVLTMMMMMMMMMRVEVVERERRVNVFVMMMRMMVQVMMVSPRFFSPLFSLHSHHAAFSHYHHSRVFSLFSPHHLRVYVMVGMMRRRRGASRALESTVLMTVCMSIPMSMMVSMIPDAIIGKAQS